MTRYVYIAEPNPGIHTGKFLVPFVVKRFFQIHFHGR